MVFTPIRFPATITISHHITTIRMSISSARLTPGAFSFLLIFTFKKTIELEYVIFICYTAVVLCPPHTQFLYERGHKIFAP